ncbi:hypothetical protein CGJ15_24005 [Vibrio parahaemolyticus]|nr:hypothetical protein CGJ15_24005 [Vibrio parahaemolyticus]
MGNAANKAFKSDSQRLAFSLRSSIAKRRSHLNAALVANEKNAAKTKYLGLRSVCFWLNFRISISSHLGL